ncbi:MAG: hypothetical protein HUU50_18395 [Candidatus Brocadiae bacterium]|nr:hypothetical protein [Candidatus Brocadiia bacterium]
MQIAHYNVAFQGQSYTPNVFRGEHNLISLEVNLSLNHCADRVRVLFGGGSNFAAKLKDPIDITLGDEQSKPIVFRGKIAHLSFQATCIIIDAQKSEHSLFALHFNQLFQKQSCGAIVREILSRASLDSGNIEDGITLSHYPLGIRWSGYDHIQALAQKNDFIFFSNADNQFHFQKPIKKASKKKFSYKKDILELQNTEHLPEYEGFLVYGEGAASVKGEDAENWLHKNPDDYSGKAGKGNTWIEEHPELSNKQISLEVSKKIQKSFQRKKTSGKIVTLGAAEIFPGDCISISDCPMASCNKTFMVFSVRHIFNRTDGFISQFTFMDIE